MTPILVIVILLITLLVDYFWLDINRKRWGWFKNSSKRTRVIIFSLLLLAIFAMYLSGNTHYF